MSLCKGGALVSELFIIRAANIHSAEAVLFYSSYTGKEDEDGFCQSFFNFITTDKELLSE